MTSFRAFPWPARPEVSAPAPSSAFAPPAPFPGPSLLLCVWPLLREDIGPSVVGVQETPEVTGKIHLGLQDEAGQRLIEFCQENALG